MKDTYRHHDRPQDFRSLSRMQIQCLEEFALSIDLQLEGIFPYTLKIENNHENGSIRWWGLMAGKAKPDVLLDYTEEISNPAQLLDIELEGMINLWVTLVW